MTPELTPNQRRRVEELFHQAVGLTAGQRAALLDRSCADAPGVRHEVEQLMHHHDAGADTAPPGDATPTTGATLRHAVAVLDDMSGEHVGPYKLLQRIGRGGFGDVYMADQEEPVRRRVRAQLGSAVGTAGVLLKIGRQVLSCQMTGLAPAAAGRACRPSRNEPGPTVTTRSVHPAGPGAGPGRRS